MKWLPPARLEKQIIHCLSNFFVQSNQSKVPYYQVLWKMHNYLKLCRISSEVVFIYLRNFAFVLTSRNLSRNLSNIWAHALVSYIAETENVKSKENQIENLQFKMILQEFNHTDRKKQKTRIIWCWIWSEGKTYNFGNLVIIRHFNTRDQSQHPMPKFFES